MSEPTEKVVLRIVVEIPSTGLTRAEIEQEVGEHVLGDARRYQAYMALNACTKRGGVNGEIWAGIMRHRETWGEILDKATIEIIE